METLEKKECCCCGAGEATVEQKVGAVLARHPKAGREMLIPILQEVQSAVGFLSREAVKQVGEHLSLPTSKIYGVATFYNQFRFQAQGRYHVQVCRGTACHVKGSAATLEAVQRELGIGPEETTKDGLFSLEVVACVGACGLAPVISVNGEVYGGVTAEKVKGILDSYRNR
jgi:NADH-quinone oxidoreductase subunit E